MIKLIVARRYEKKKKISPHEKIYICVKLQSESFFFFFLRFVFTIFYTGSFQVPPEEKSPPPKVPIPSQNPNLT